MPTVRLVGCLWLSGVGALLEVVGLGLVAFELWHEQRRDFGGFAWVRRVRAWWRYRRGHRPVGASVELSGTGGAGATASGTVTVGRAAPPLDERVTAVEAALAALREESRTRSATLEDRVTNVSSRIDEVRSDLDHQIQERERERKEARRESMRLQWYGTGLFAVGAILSFLGNAVSC